MKFITTLMQQIIFIKVVAPVIYWQINLFELLEIFKPVKYYIVHHGSKTLF